MSDDSFDDEFLNFTAAPIPTAQPKQSIKRGSTKTSISKAASRHKASQSEHIYGEELFKAAWKPVKSVVVCFWPYTKNMIRVSKDEHKGKFAIKYNVSSDGGLVLYYFDPPLDWDYPTLQNGDLDRSVELQIEVNDSVRIYGPYEDANKIKLLVASILRKEALVEKKKLLEDLRANESAARAEKERLENEADEINEKLAEAGILFDPNQSIVRETETTIVEGKEEKEISSEVSEEKIDDGSKIVKDRSGATLKLTPISW